MKYMNKGNLGSPEIFRHVFGVESLEKSSSSVVYDCGGLGFFVGRVIKVSELLKNSRVCIALHNLSLTFCSTSRMA